MSKRFPKPRKWIPKNPEKYAGDVNNIITRSSWETKMMNWLDQHKSVAVWNSEGCKIDYYSPVDNRMHKYHVDFVAKMKLKDGTFKTFMIEVKPKSQCSPPRKSSNKERMITEITTYVVNKAKWEAAEAFCSKNNMTFMILTEEDLCI